MASTIRLHVNNIAAGQTYLNFSPGGGTYELANNDVTGKGWTPTIPQPLVFQTGGPPFTDGAEQVLRAYPNIEETIPIQIKAANHNALVSARRTLQRYLHSFRLQEPGVLTFQPDAATLPSNFAVYGGEVQDDFRAVHDEAGRGTWRGTMKILRAPWAVDGSNLTASGGSATIGNASNSATVNYVQWSSLLGELRSVGQPVSLNLNTAASGMFASAGIQRCYLGTLAAAPSRTNVATAMSTSSTSGVDIATTDPGGASLTNGAYGGLRYRFVARITSPSSNLEIQIRVVSGNAALGSGQMLYTSPWIAPGTSTTVVDLGSIEPPVNGGPIRVICRARSTSGAAVSGTWADFDTLVYRTWCRITSTVSLTGPRLLIRTYDSFGAIGNNGAMGVPSVRPYVAFLSSGTSLQLDTPEVRGTLPVAIEGYYLYLMALTGNAYDSTDTGTLARVYLPLYSGWIGDGT